METLSFAFGMLAIIAVALVAVVVVGMIKVLKMQKEITNLEQWIDRVDSSIHQRINDEQRELSLRIDSLNSYVDSRFDKMENKFIGNSAKKQVLND